MRHHRRGNPQGDRLSKFLRDSVESDFARHTEGRIKAFLTEKTLLSTCLGVAGGFALGILFRRKP